MKNRRSFLLAVVACFVALGVVVGPALADELIGVITKVDVTGKKITVTTKGADVEVKITGDTEWVTKKGSMPVDLEKLDRVVKKQQDAGKKGVVAKIEHEKATASKIFVPAKKKEQN